MSLGRIRRLGGVIVSLDTSCRQPVAGRRGHETRAQEGTTRHRARVQFERSRVCVLIDGKRLNTFLNENPSLGTAMH